MPTSQGCLSSRPFGEHWGFRLQCPLGPVPASWAHMDRKKAAAEIPWGGLPGDLGEHGEWPEVQPEDQRY